LAGVAAAAAAAASCWPVGGEGAGDGAPGLPEEGCGVVLPVGGAPPCVGGGAAPGGFFFLDGMCVALPGCEVQGPFATYGECVSGCIFVNASLEALAEDLLQSYYYWDYDFEQDGDDGGER